MDCVRGDLSSYTLYRISLSKGLPMVYSRCPSQETSKGDLQCTSSPEKGQLPFVLPLPQRCPIFFVMPGTHEQTRVTDWIECPAVSLSICTQTHAKPLLPWLHRPATKTGPSGSSSCRDIPQVSTVRPSNRDNLHTVWGSIPPVHSPPSN